MATDWSKYGPCDVCGAERGQPCFDRRTTRNHYGYPFRKRAKTTTATAHRQRSYATDRQIQLTITAREMIGLLKLIPDGSRFIVTTIEPAEWGGQLRSRMYEVHIKVQLEMDLRGPDVQNYLDDLAEGDDLGG